MPDRDFAAEMNALCRQMLNDSDRPLPVVAHDLVAAVRASDPDLLNGWLDQRATDFVRDHLGHMVRGDRALSRTQERPRAFAQAAAAFEAGDRAALGARFRAEHLIDEEGTRRKVADMTGADHLFVAGRYNDDSRHAAFLARVHRAVGKRVGARKTSEVYTEDQYAAMFSTQRAGTASAA